MTIKFNGAPARVLLFILFLGGSLYAGDAAAPTGPDLQSLPAGVSIYQLDNGMQVLLIENPALPMVGVNVVVKVGSAYETFASSGMSHTLEHLLFNGTTTRTQKQLYDDVDMIGGYNNANTSEFYTNFMMVTPAENIEKGMRIQADMLFNSTLPEDKFEKEKGIVLEEISKTLADPEAQAERNTAAILFRGHALSLPTLGTYSTIEHMSRDDVYAFYKNNYAPNNMLLSVVGNFRTSDMLEMIKKIYGGIAPTTVQRPAIPEWSTGLHAPQTAPQRDMVYHRFYDGEDVRVQLLYGIRPANDAVYELLDLVLDKRQNELQMALKEAWPEVKSLSLSTRPTPFGGYIEMTISFEDDVNDAAVQEASKKLLEMDFSLPAETVDAEVVKARTAFLKNIEKPHMFGIYNAHLLAVEGVEAVLASYSGDDLYAAAGELTTLTPEPPVAIVQHPAAKKEKESAAAVTTKLYQDAPGKSLIVVQNKASNLLAIHYLVKHKAVYESKYGKDAAKILHDCFGQRMKSEENQKLSGRFGLTFTVNDNPYIPMDDIYLHPDFGYIRVEGLADDAPGAINYVNDQIKEFVPTEQEFNIALQKLKRTSMMMQGNQAKNLFNETWRSLVYEPSPYPTGPESMNYENLKAFTKEYFRPGNMIVCVVSPAAPESIDSLFADFGGAVEEPPVVDKTLKLHKEAITKELQGGGDRAYIFWGFTREIDPRDAPALKALSLILSDMITFDIREKQGMAYRMSAGISVVGDRALFYVNQGTRPQNVDALLPQYADFFKAKRLDDVSESDFEKSINMYLGRMMFRRLSSINRAYYLSHSLYFHGDIDYDNEFLAALKKATLADVKKAAKKYLKVKNPIVVVSR